MLSYANNMPELIQSMNEVDEDIINYDFLAKRFNMEAKSLLRRGLGKGYISHIEETNRLGGRLLLTESMPYILEKKPMVVCEKDEYSRDIFSNQIMKKTLQGLFENRLVQESTRKESFHIWEQLTEVSTIYLNKKTFTTLQFNRNNMYYKPMIHIAKMLYELQLLSHKSGEWSLFTASLNDTDLNRIFEEFLLRFYQLEQNQYHVQSEKLQWQLEGNTALLPGMRTDVSMTHKNGKKKIIIDAKFYKEIFQNYYDKSSFRSGHMYQLFTYLMHQPQKLKLRGVLLYPFNGKVIDEVYEWRENTSIEIKSIHLGEGWTELYKRLIKIIQDC